MKHVVTIFFSCILFGCTSIEKATQKVLTNEQAFEKVGRKYKALNPCINDTIAYFINGDTTITEVHDTAYIKHIDTFTVRAKVDTLRITRTVTKRIVDTLVTTVKDVEEIIYLQAKLGTISSEAIQHQQKQIKAEKTARSYLISFIVSLLLNLAFLILLFKRK